MKRIIRVLRLIEGVLAMRPIAVHWSMVRVSLANEVAKAAYSQLAKLGRPS